MRLSQRILLTSAAAVVVVAGVTAGALASDSSPPRVASGGGLSLERTQSGTLIDDPFRSPTSDRDLQDTYEFNGDLDPNRAFVHATADGLRVGVQPPSDSEDFDGWFAVTLAAYPRSSVFHVRMSKPAGNVSGPDREAESVFAVQTASTKVTGLINFVEVTSDSLKGRTAYQVDYSSGHIRDAKTKVYWRSEPTTNAPNTQDITIRTDGSHSLTVWLGDQQIFSSAALHLDMEAPFQPYLEVQSLHTPYVATFQDFWVTRDNTVQVQGLPAGAAVDLTATGGKQLATATADQSGTAVLTVPPYAAKGSGVVTITRPGGSPQRLGPFDYAGGDIFRLSGS